MNHLVMTTVIDHSKRSSRIRACAEPHDPADDGASGRAQSKVSWLASNAIAANRDGRCERDRTVLSIVCGLYLDRAPVFKRDDDGAEGHPCP